MAQASATLEPELGRRSVGSTVRAYVTLTKPRARAAARDDRSRHDPRAGRDAEPLARARDPIGGAMSAASAAAFNMYLDRDIDAHMHRTENRPLVTGEISPRAGLVFAWTSRWHPRSGCS
jgi:protoheme IX farnesyltransferase